MNDVNDVNDVNDANDVNVVQMVNGELIWETFFSQLLYIRIVQNICSLGLIFCAIVYHHLCTVQ